MTMADYLDMRAYWAANPPLQSLAAAYFKIKPKRVRRHAKASAEAGVGAVDAAKLRSELGGLFG
jgi:hypothetical protein